MKNQFCELGSEKVVTKPKSTFLEIIQQKSLKFEPASQAECAGYQKTSLAKIIHLLSMRVNYST